MDRRILISGSIASNVAMVATLVVGLALTAVLVRYLGAAQFGIWAILNTITHYAALATMGVPAAVTWRVASERGAGRTQSSLDVIVAGTIVMGALGAFAGGVVYASIGPLASFFNIASGVAGEFRGAMSALAVAVTLGGVATSISAGLVGMERLLAASVVNIAASIARLLITLAFLEWGLGLVGAMWGYAVSHLVVIAGGIAFVVTHRPSAPNPPPRQIAVHFPPLLRFSSSAAVLTIASNVTMTAAVVVSGRLLPSEAVAIVAIVMMLAGQMVSLVVATMRPLEPRLATLSGSNREADQKRLLYRSLLLSATLSFAMLVVLVVLGKDILLLWVGPSFSSAALPLSIAALAFSISLAQIPLMALIMAKARHRAYGWLVCFEALVNVLLTIWLCGRFGPIGAVLGTAIPLALIRGFVISVWGCQLLGLDLRRYLLVLLGPATAAAITIGAGSLLHMLTAAHSISILIVGGPLLMSAYLLALLVSLRVIDWKTGSHDLGFLLSLFPATAATRLSALLRRPS